MGQYGEFYASDEGALLRQSLDTIHEEWSGAPSPGGYETGLSDDWRPELPIEPGLGLEESIGVVIDFLKEAVGGLSEPSFPLGWVGPIDGEPSPEELLYRDRALQMTELGAWLLVNGRLSDPRACIDMWPILTWAIDDPILELDELLRRRGFRPDPERLPGLGNFDELMRSTCGRGLTEALTGLSVAVSGYSRPRERDGVAIAEVAPRLVCPGSTVQLLGKGFGNNEPNDQVRIVRWPTYGSCQPVETTSWTDSEITAVVPPDFTGAGEFGIIVKSGGGLDRVHEALGQLAGEMTRCMGAWGAVKAGGALGQLEADLARKCPSPAPASRIWSGPPRVDVRATNGSRVGALGWAVEVIPGGDVTIEWTITAAEKVTLSATGGLSLGKAGLTSIDLSQPLDPSLDIASNPQTGSFTFRVDLPEGAQGKYLFEAENDCGSATSTITVSVDVKTALVLQGGGAKGAFAVGAVRCLTDVAQVRPDIVTGASVGALNAAKLVQHSGDPQPLEDLWLGLTGPGDLYEEWPWFKVLSAPLKTALASGSSFTWGTVLESVGRLGANLYADRLIGGLTNLFGLPGLHSLFSLYDAITAVVDIAKFADAVNEAISANSIFDASPVRQLIESNIDADAVLASGIELRVTAVHLADMVAHVFNERGYVVSPAARRGVQAHLRDVLCASAAIPLAFSSVYLPNPYRNPDGSWNLDDVLTPPENPGMPYVDGGTTENSPIVAALDAGAQRAFVVHLEPAPSPGELSTFPHAMVQAGVGAAGAVMGELWRGDNENYGGWPVPITRIAPSFLVHGTLDVDPGLIRINMDYGYLCAYDDAVSTNRAWSRSNSDEITRLRMDVWDLEHSAFGYRLPHVMTQQTVPVSNIAALRTVREKKRRIFDLIAQRDQRFGPDASPRGRAAWWQGFEAHYFAPRIGSPWEEFTDRNGAVLKAETSP
jgi:predicted acylesterase/phospholipase RssA